MSQLDPRLRHVLAAARWVALQFILGGIALLVVGAMPLCAVLLTKVTPGQRIGGIVIGLCFVAMGAFVLRSGLRGPSQTLAMRLLTTERDKVASWSLRMVSFNGRTPVKRMVVVTRNGYRQMYPLPSDEEEEALVDYMSEMLPRAD